VHYPGRECTPKAKQVSIFRELGRSGRWERLFRQFERVFRRRLKHTEKDVNFLGEEKCTPDKILAKPMVCSYSRNSLKRVL